jgi:hypothetical protein
MTDAKWLDEYSGQTVEQLIGLEGEYRTDSIVLAFEQALDRKASTAGPRALSSEERVVLAVEAMEREVNNGGVDQFFTNSSREYAATIVASLRRIGCHATAEVMQRAVAALGLPDLNAEKIEAAMAGENETRDEEFSVCDHLYYNAGEDIAGLLLAFIKANKPAFNL